MPLGFSGPPSSNAAPSPLAGPLGAIGSLLQGYMQGRMFRDEEQAHQQDQAAKMFDIYRTIAQANPDSVKDPKFMAGVSSHLTALGMPNDQLGAALTALTPEQQIQKSNADIARRKSGVDITLPEKMQYIAPGATPDVESNHYRHLAAFYAARGADDQAQKYENMAKDAMNEYNRRQADAQRFSLAFDEHMRKVKADAERAGHWTRADQAKFDAIKAGLQGRIITGEYSVERANIMADAAIQNTNTRVAGSERNTDVREAGANQRMQYRVTNDRINKEYNAADKAWNDNQKQASIAVRMGKMNLLPPGWSTVGADEKTPVDGKPTKISTLPPDKLPNGVYYVDGLYFHGPPKPLTPDDFTTKVNDTLDLIRQNKFTSKQAIQKIGELKGLSPAQRSEAIKAFTNPQYLRGSDATAPFPQYPGQ